MAGKVIQQTLHLGRTNSPDKKKAGRIKLTDFADVAYILPKIPLDFGHETCKPATGWGMNLNDQLGDCVIAGAYHEHDLFNTINGRSFKYTDVNVLKVYEKVAGYDPKQTNPETGENPTDGGTDMEAAARYRRVHGIPDKYGHLHRIDGYVALEPGNWEQARVAMYLFGAMGVGMLFSDANWDQFVKGQPWDYVRGAALDSGHYIPGVGDRGNVTSTITWGRTQGMTRMCYDKQVDEALAYVSKEYVNRKGKTPEGLDLNAMLAAIKEVTKVQEPNQTPTT
jgi:hypothetical protein